MFFFITECVVFFTVMNFYSHQPNNQVPFSSEKVIMTFYASLSLVAFSASVTLPTLSHFVRPSKIFSRCFLLLHFPSFPSIIPSSLSQDVPASPSLLIGQKRLAGFYHSIYDNFVMSAFRNTVNKV